MFLRPKTAWIPQITYVTGTICRLPRPWKTSEWGLGSAWAPSNLWERTRSEASSWSLPGPYASSRALRMAAYSPGLRIYPSYLSQTNYSHNTRKSYSLKSGMLFEAKALARPKKVMGSCWTRIMSGSFSARFSWKSVGTSSFSDKCGMGHTG